MTGVVRGFDSAAVPGPVTRAAAKAQGAVWWGGYLGGPDAAATWSAAEFDAVRSDGFAILAIWVPAQVSGLASGTGSAMAASATAVGVPRGSLLALDAEPALAAWLGAHPGATEALSADLSARGYELAVYGVSSAAGAVGGDVRWLASWEGTDWPAALPAGDVDWQWAGPSSPVAGTDADICTTAAYGRMWGAHPTQATGSATGAPAPVAHVGAPVNRQVRIAGQWTTVVDCPISLGAERSGWIDLPYAPERIVGVVAKSECVAYITQAPGQMPGQPADFRGARINVYGLVAGVASASVSLVLAQ